MSLDAFGHEDMASFINNSRWKPSSPTGRYAKWPHEYTCSNWGERDLEEFRAVAAYVEENGYDQPWPYPNSRYIQRYINVGGHKYWRMTNAERTDITINRVPL